MSLTTAEIRQKFISSFNHRFDGKARQDFPDLTEEQRFFLALNDLVEEGITELKENDILWCLANVQKAHTTRTYKPSRRGNGELMSQEAADHANNVTYNILTMFVRFGYVDSSNLKISDPAQAILLLHGYLW